MKKWNYNEDLEKTLTAIFGFVSITAIIVNLTIKGYTCENILNMYCRIHRGKNEYGLL